MIPSTSYYKGHRGAVTALAGAEMGDSFFSSGAEGLIVRWRLSKPNEGDVITKLAGYVSVISYDKHEGLIYAALNHKGIYGIKISSGKKVKFIDIPSISFKKIEITEKTIIIATTNGELLVVAKKTNTIINRIHTGLENSVFTTKNDYLFYMCSEGIKRRGVCSTTPTKLLFPYTDIVLEIFTWNESIIIYTMKGLFFWRGSKINLEIDFQTNPILTFQKMYIDEDKSELIGVSTSNIISRYKLTKKGILLIKHTQIEQNGQINDLLWIENYKFVITAGADKKIGVWQLN